MHIADLHIGRRIGEFSLVDDQRFILRRMLEIADAEQPDAVLIAGDVYDKGLPPGDAVSLLDDFLTALAGRHLAVFLVSGNHDSPERLEFGSRLLTRNGLHIAGVFDGTLHAVALRDRFGPVTVWMLPFVKPAAVKPFFPDAQIDSYDAAVRTAVAAAGVNPDERNVLVAHQFVTGAGREPERSDSESVSVGGLDNVDFTAFDGFDYVALGHIHGPQWVGRTQVRYAGSPLKYSFSEARQHKSVTMVELGEKGDVAVRAIPLVPLHDMRELKGPIDRLLEAGAQADGRADYIRAVLTDEGEIFDAVGRLRAVYPNLMRLNFENARTAAAEDPAAQAEALERRAPLELFADFYREQNGTELSPEQRRLLTEILAETEEDGQ